MRALFVTDPIGGLRPEVDATVGLMLASRRHGLETWVCGPEHLRVVDGRLRVTARRVELAPVRRAGDHRWLVARRWWRESGSADLDVAGECAQVHLRIDPPVDSRYLRTTYLLDLAEEAGRPVDNRPAGVRAVHEKAVALRFPGLTPATLVSADPAELREFVVAHRTVVVKPFDGFAGTDVWLVHDDPCATALLESATASGRRHVIAQHYLGEVRRGNKRLFLLDGEVIGAVLRRPAGDDFRIGPPDAVAHVDDDDLRILDAVGPLLAGHGIRLAGLDVIGGRLIEVNVTCPGGMHKADALLGTDLSGTIVRRLLEPAMDQNSSNGRKLA